MSAHFFNYFTLPWKIKASKLLSTLQWKSSSSSTSRRLLTTYYCMLLYIRTFAKNNRNWINRHIVTAYDYRYWHLLLVPLRDIRLALPYPFTEDKLDNSPCISRKVNMSVFCKTFSAIISFCAVTKEPEKQTTKSLIYLGMLGIFRILTKHNWSSYSVKTSIVRIFAKNEIRVYFTPFFYGIKLLRSIAK